MTLEGPATRLTVMVGESDQAHHHPVYTEIVHRAHKAGLAGASVFRGIEGYGKSNHIHTTRILSLSDDLPIAITIIDNDERITAFLPQLDELVTNGLVIVDQLMRSSTRLYAHPDALEVPAKRERIETLVLLLRSVLDARERVMLEVNVTAACLEAVIEVLPSMREPTMAPLHGEQGFALKAAVPRRDLPRVIPAIKARGGTDIVVTALAQIVP